MESESDTKESDHATHLRPPRFGAVPVRPAARSCWDAALVLTDETGSNMDWQSNEGDSPVIDENVIESLRELGGEDDPGLVAELIEMFLEDAPRHLDDMITGLESGDLEIVHRSAHTLKSSAANMGAMILSSLCKEVEELARTECVDELGPKARFCREAFSATKEALEAVEG